MTVRPPDNLGPECLPLGEIPKCYVVNLTAFGQACLFRSKLPKIILKIRQLFRGGCVERMAGSEEKEEYAMVCHPSNARFIRGYSHHSEGTTNIEVTRV